LIIGGEDYPDLDWHFDASALSAKYSRLIVVALTGYIEGADAGPAVDLLVQARTGLVNEQMPDRPVRFSMALPSYGAALMAHIGLWTALIDRERTGKGQVVRSSMQQGTALFWSQIWMDATKPDAAFDKLPPKGVKRLIFSRLDLTEDYLEAGNAFIEKRKPIYKARMTESCNLPFKAHRKSQTHLGAGMFEGRCG
jgi:hypothetical protein